MLRREKETREKGIRLHLYFLKNYKKNTLAVFSSFALTFMLLTIILVLIHTNYKISNIQLKTEFTPSDCYIDGLSKEQAKELQKDPDMKWTALQQGAYDFYKRNGQNVFLEKQDNTAITMMAKIVEGRLPEAEREIAAEKWVLLNLGIEPAAGQDITITDDETGEEKVFQLVGILSDIYANKKYGVLTIYSSMYRESKEDYAVYMEFRDPVDYDSKVKALMKEMGIKKKQVHECPAREDLPELYVADAKIISVILLICLVAFYGVYRITVLSRVQQYGILRAVGMKKRQIYRMLWWELSCIYLAGAPFGILCGVFISDIVMRLSGDRNLEVYLLNEAVRFGLVIPVWQIILCVVIAFLFVSVIGYMVGRKVTEASVIETIAGESFGKADTLFSLQHAATKSGTLLRMSLKYIFRDLKISGFAVLTICLGVTLFTGLAYKAKTLKIYREDTKEMYYLNGEYALTMLHFDRTDEGLSRQSVKKIENLEEIAVIRTSAGLPVRIIDEDNVKRNEAYYDDYNARRKKIDGYEDRGYDGEDTIYKSMLLGYNEGALGALQKYVVEGGFKPDDMKEDEAVLFVPRMDDTKNNELPGFYKEGTPLMEYHAGDKVTLKYREDFKTETRQYEELKDHGARYIYKTYKIAAVVSFPYMYDCNITMYPLLIIDDEYMQKIAPGSGIQCMYCDGASDMDLRQQSRLEQKLIRIGSTNENISARSLISEVKQNEMFYRKQMVYICGIAVITFILVMINMINNFRYRMQKRTREISMLRAVGMSVAMTKRMMLCENLILGAAAVLTAFLLSQPVLRYLYRISDMQSFGHEFWFAYGLFSFVSSGALIVCALLSFGILKTWKTRQITEGIRGE